MEVFFILSILAFGGIAYSNYLKRKKVQQEVAKLQERIKIMESTKAATSTRVRKSKSNATITVYAAATV